MTDETESLMQFPCEFSVKAMGLAEGDFDAVVVEIVRDGQRMQLVLPRGPLGITGSGANMAFRGSFGG